jgi:hypothetical protein
MTVISNRKIGERIFHHESRFDGVTVEAAVKAGVSLRDANLSYLDLTAVNLKGVDLDGASFKHTRLYNARFDGANLAGCDMTGANLYAAVLKDANLDNAILESAIITNADFSGAMIRDTVFQNVTMFQTKMKGAVIAISSELTGSPVLFSIQCHKAMHFGFWPTQDGVFYMDRTYAFQIDQESDCFEEFPKEEQDIILASWEYAKGALE